MPIEQRDPGRPPKRSDAAETGSTTTKSERARRQSRLLDEGLEEIFPASDPVSVMRVD